MAWFVGLVAAAVIVVIVLLALWRLRRVYAELNAERAALADSRRSAEHLETRISTLRQELAEQHRENVELSAKMRAGGDSGATGLWALERLRQNRLAGTPVLPTITGPGMNIAADLGAAVALELELLREEVGTYAEVTGVELGHPVGPGEALAVLRVVQELTAALAKRSDELTITIERDGDAARVTVVAAGWSDGSSNHTVLERSVAALDGTLELRPEAGVLTADVRIPSRN
jgi:hypothetical protein